jgi:putative addiction module killer protein
MLLKQSATFRKWQSKLPDPKAKALIAMRLQRLANGNAGDAAPVGEGVSELRIHYGPGYRIYFQRRGDILILLLCGGDKGTQDRDIRIAKQIAAQWADNQEE